MNAVMTMTRMLKLHEWACFVAIRCLLRLAVAFDDHRRNVSKRVRRFERRLRSLYRRWLVRQGKVKPPPFARGQRPHNRTPEHIEQQVVRLHVEQPHLGAGQLRWLAARVIGFSAARETFRQILIRRRDLVVALQDERRRTPRRIEVKRRGSLWGLDLTLVWVLAIVPVWLLGIVDYHGSRLLTLQRIKCWPTAQQIAGVLETTIDTYGAPERILTDRAPILRAEVVELLLARHGTRHQLIKPCHAWTNGRIERIFRTFKDTVFRHAGLWLLSSFGQIDRFCADFLLFYNQGRPHSAYRGSTPDEIFFGRNQQPASGRVSYFDGRLHCYRFD